MNSLAMFSLTACAALAVLLAVCTARAGRRDAAMLQKLREGALYRQLYHALARLDPLDIDEVRVEASGVTVTSVCPAHTVLAFSFKQNGNSLRNTGLTRLYAELIARDYPHLTRAYAYKLHSYRVYRPNGKSERAYAFIMRRGYKDSLLAERGPAQLRIL